jgi:DNA repair exonuclease SbcCD ATPase subunit
MIIKSISLKNFKSFGNNKQTVKFNTTTGDLILISGKNGGGKSSFQQSFDFSIFGIVRGKKGKRVAQSILPNRINKNLETEIEFVNNQSDTIKIQRNLEPILAKIFINDQDETKKFKNYKKEDRDKVIGFDFETYKSFISMSVSDFANFIDLTPEEKRNIINKLFNLQDLDNYLSLTNGLIKQSKEEKLKYETIIETNNQTITTLNQNIITIKRSGILDKEKEIENLEKEKLSKKEPYLKSKKDIQTCDEKLKEIEKQRQDFDNQKNIVLNDILEIKVDIRNIEDKLKVYESGVCPVCNTDLNDEKHLHDLSDFHSKQTELNQKLDGLEKNKNEIILKLTQLSNQKEATLKLRTNSNIQLNNLVYELKTLTTKIGNLKETKSDVSIDELIKNIEELKTKNAEHTIKIKEIDTNIQVDEELKEVFSNKGVRKSIIKNIVKPINVYLKDILDELKSPYNVKIDEEFNVNIFERLTFPIDPESLSMGESKKINIAIALSYLKLMLKFRKLNILFLDEVFSSMEPENVEFTIKVLKDFTKEFNLNIIILDPKVYFTDNSFLLTYFDRIIKIYKKMSFSTIEEELNVVS